ncbi:3-demethylubiquinone-9 3-O-methyltransferase [Verruconis gallopava]|uniref:Ubiquinone biosynthesis O-methyltransferase, mitochondrial n=1 Tax=Verruconis gallopava TaxID=253628 RepID=A0A0D1XJK8_9PEZI|nr:3-demethylubiquinone-9 3-O-methyltransferase [Verruconis gallopava]KIW02481.1 3-demethylubiquinone-9 3-O-methyltransferase [Verruconis gallopava]
MSRARSILERARNGRPCTLPRAWSAVSRRHMCETIASPGGARLLSTAPRCLHQASTTSSVDPTEVNHFNALASAWWDPHGSSRLLHLMNPMRHQFIKQCIASQADAQPAGQKLHYLDIGCGGGIFAESAARLPNTATVTAIDPTPEVFNVAEAHKRRDPMLCQSGKLTYYNIGIEDLPVHSNGNGYDVVSVFEVIEHVTNPSQFLQTVLPHVKPGGWLIMSTIARTWTSWFITNVMAEDILGIVPKGTHDWNKYLNENELRDWFTKREGWESPRAMGVLYVPGLGWKDVPRGEEYGNYFFGVRKSPL